MRITLKAKILGSTYGSQRRFGFACGLTENRLSMIVQGWADPTEAERASICDELNVFDQAEAENLFANDPRRGEVEHAMREHRHRS